MRASEHMKGDIEIERNRLISHAVSPETALSKNPGEGLRCWWGMVGHFLISHMFATDQVLANLRADTALRYRVL